MPTKDKDKNKAYVRKSRQKLINTIGIDAYRKRNADAQREYRKKKKALKNANISDRRLRSFDINELVQVRKELKKDKAKTKKMI